MVRTQISLTEDQKHRLDAKSAETGLSLSRLIRQAIDECFGPTRDVEADLNAIRQAVGGWRDRDDDGAQYVERLRSARRLER